MARPKKFQFSDVQYDEVKLLGSRGITIEDMAYYFDMSPRTFYRYKDEDPRIMAEHKKGRILANLKVSESLFRQATEEGSVGAMCFWLKCQAGWKENHEIKLTFTQQTYGHTDLNKLTDSEFENLFQKAMETLDEPKQITSNRKESRISE